MWSVLCVSQWSLSVYSRHVSLRVDVSCSCLQVFLCVPSGFAAPFVARLLFIIIFLLFSFVLYGLCSIPSLLLVFCPHSVYFYLNGCGLLLKYLLLLPTLWNISSSVHEVPAASKGSRKHMLILCRLWFEKWCITVRLRYTQAFTVDSHRGVGLPLLMFNYFWLTLCHATFHAVNHVALCVSQSIIWGLYKTYLRKKCLFQKQWHLRYPGIWQVGSCDGWDRHTQLF